MPKEQMTVEQFGATVKAKHPQYVGYTDYHIGKLTLEKHPQYQKVVKPESLPSRAVSKLYSGAEQFALGTAKTVVEQGQRASRVLNLPGQVAEFATKGRIKAEAAPVFGVPTDTDLERKTFGEKAGQAFVEVGESLAMTPGLKVGQAAIGAKFAGPGLLPAVQRVVGKAILEGGAYGGLTFAQTEDLKKAGWAAAFIGGLKILTGTAGEIAKSAGLPETLMSRIYRDSLKDTQRDLTVTGVENIKRTQPALYQSYLDEGVVTVKDGKTIVDKNLARRALEAGLKGSVDAQAKTVVAGKLSAEQQVRRIAKNSKELISMEEKNLRKLFLDIADDYADVGDGEIAETATKLAKTIKTRGGNVPVLTALEGRRLLDKLRYATSFNNPPARLTLSQQNLLHWSNVLRHRINDVQGMGPVMDKYSFYFSALESLGKEAHRRQSAAIVNLVDSTIFGGTFIGSGEPTTAFGFVLLRRLTKSPGLLTGAAQAIEKGVLTLPGAAAKTAAIPLANEALGVE